MESLGGSDRFEDRSAPMFAGIGTISGANAQTFAVLRQQILRKELSAALLLGQRHFLHGAPTWSILHDVLD
eukprot:990916-Rhodomonas_salina.2